MKCPFCNIDMVLAKIEVRFSEIKIRTEDRLITEKDDYDAKWDHSYTSYDERKLSSDGNKYCNKCGFLALFAY